MPRHIVLALPVSLFSTAPSKVKRKYISLYAKHLTPFSYLTIRYLEDRIHIHHGGCCSGEPFERASTTQEANPIKHTKHRHRRHR